MRRVLSVPLRLAVDFALPPRCPSCGLVVGADHLFCVTCWSRLTFLGEPCCRRCGLPFADGTLDGLDCGQCPAEPPPFDRLRAAVAYGDIARGVALRLKYGGRPGVAQTLARLMRRHLGEADPALLVAPVPLHRWRIWRRGYNQAALIARALGGGTLVPDLLQRTRATPVLRGLGRSQRRTAVRGAFRVADRHRENVRGRDVLLVDDVFTSGATAGACARVLKRAGAARVDVLCWARVLREELD